jgi:hypothetical protein
LRISDTLASPGEIGGKAVVERDSVLGEAEHTVFSSEDEAPFGHRFQLLGGMQA